MALSAPSGQIDTSQLRDAANGANGLNAANSAKHLSSDTDRVLVLSPGVTLTLGSDALLLSCKFCCPSTHKRTGLAISRRLLVTDALPLCLRFANAGQLASKPSRSCLGIWGSGERCHVHTMIMAIIGAPWLFLLLADTAPSS